LDYVSEHHQRFVRVSDVFEVRSLDERPSVVDEAVWKKSSE